MDAAGLTILASELAADVAVARGATENAATWLQNRGPAVWRLYSTVLQKSYHGGSGSAWEVGAHDDPLQSAGRNSRTRRRVSRYHAREYSIRHRAAHPHVRQKAERMRSARARLAKTPLFLARVAAEMRRVYEWVPGTGPLPETVRIK